MNCECKKLNLLKPAPLPMKFIVDGYVVEFEKENLLITIRRKGHTSERYYIPLDRCNDSAEILDWLMQIFPKTWMTPGLFHAVVKCFRNAWLIEFLTRLRDLIDETLKRAQ